MNVGQLLISGDRPVLVQKRQILVNLVHILHGPGQFQNTVIHPADRHGHRDPELGFQHLQDPPGILYDPPKTRFRQPGEIHNANHLSLNVRGVDCARKSVLQSIPENEVAVHPVHLPGGEQIAPGFRAGGEKQKIPVGEVQAILFPGIQRFLCTPEISAAQQPGDVQVTTVTVGAAQRTPQIL